MSLKIVDVILEYETDELVGSDYSIVELEGGKFAFVWGNISTEVGSILPNRFLTGSSDERGFSLHDTFDLAAEAWSDCGEALEESDSPVADEMLVALHYCLIEREEKKANQCRYCRTGQGASCDCV